MKRTGKSFEALVTWINSGLHESATVLANQRLRDKDTGKPRQVDILITLQDGPSTFTAIVEVRDRGRPVGVEYIEQVDKKRTAVGVDAAFVVSRSGYYATARTKAAAYGIRLFSYEEALAEEWSKWLQCLQWSIVERRFDNVSLRLGDTNAAAGYAVIRVAHGIINTMRSDARAKVFCDSAGAAIASTAEFVDSLLKHKDAWSELVPGAPAVRRRVAGAPTLNPRLWIRNAQDTLTEIGAFELEADCWIEERQYPVRLSRYKAADSNASLAEVATADVVMGGRRFRFELLAPGANDFIPKGGRVELRVSSLETNPIGDAEGGGPNPPTQPTGSAGG